MTTPQIPPISCTLTGETLNDRLTWIAHLTRDSLRGYERQGLVLELRYDAEAADRVRDMVRKEQECCAFLRFAVCEGAGDIRVTITAPEAAREAADRLFEPFVASAPTQSRCGSAHRAAQP
jgi:hypothetical protein